MGVFDAFLDKACVGAQNMLDALHFGDRQPQRPYPPDRIPTPLQNDQEFSDQDRQTLASLMRINHTGEVCAQALYAGQALTAKTAGTSELMQEAALEEEDHLAWCEMRLRELDAEPSKLNPLFYTGSYFMGAVAGYIGDAWSLGFVEETERQVCKHLDSHLQKIPQEDLRTRLILEQMKIDEAKHGDSANALGAKNLPLPVRVSMKICSKIMTTTVARI